MKEKLLKLIKSQTAKDAGYVTVATGISSIIAAVFFIIVARVMGPEKLGIFSLATAASFMLADIVDIAINSSIVRFVARELPRDEGKANRFLKYIFKFKISIGIGIATTLVLLSVPLSQVIFHQSMPAVIVLVGLGTALHLIYTFTIAHLQARKRFMFVGIGIIVLPLIRALGLGVLFLFGLKSLILILVAYFLSLPFATIITMVFTPKTFLQVKNEKAISKEFYSYCLPLMVGFSIAAVSGRIDNFILANIAGATAVGYYSAAFRLFTPVQFLAGSLSTVFAPRFAQFVHKHQAKKYLQKSFLGIFILALFMLSFIWLSPQIIRLFYGDSYTQSVPILYVLFFGFAIFMLQAPFNSILLYHYSMTKAFTLVATIQLVLIIVGNILLIPILGTQGTAIVFSLTQAVALALFIGLVFVKFKQTKDD